MPLKVDNYPYAIILIPLLCNLFCDCNSVSVAAQLSGYFFSANRLLPFCFAA